MEPPLLLCLGNRFRSNFGYFDSFFANLFSVSSDFSIFKLFNARLRSFVENPTCLYHRSHQGRIDHEILALSEFQSKTP